MRRSVIILLSCLAACGAHADMMPDIVNARPAGCTAATNYLARTSGGNEAGNAANITTLICGLVTDGAITGNLSGARGCGSHFDAIWIGAQQNKTDSYLNLCGTSYSLTDPSAAVTFTTYQGWSGFSTNNAIILDTNFNATTATSPNFTQNSTAFGAWVYAVINEASNPIMGTDQGGLSGRSNLYTNQANAMVSRNNFGSGATATVTTPGTKGLFASERTTSTNTTLYWSGVSQGNFTDVSAAPLNQDFIIGNVLTGQTTGTAQIISAAFISNQLGSSLQLAVNNRFRTYMTAVGVP